ncbi:MAG: VCBS repeat-containing protein [Saprospiraceae bacterium]|nr:VCBS repeat-containing protein [Saprospiraceae bacterium]
MSNSKTSNTNRMKSIKWYIGILALLMWSSCTNDTQTSDKKFTELSSTHTGINFENTLTYDRDFNIYTYRNFYNGGGVAIGDINGDTLADLYFSANMGPNKLYLNKGDFKFQDISKAAGVEGNKAWSTGVTMADVNSDGFLDIYVCNSGDVNGDNKTNELFINDGTGKFTEQAKDFGLDNNGYSTHAVFFDFDKDGDLDMYLLNNSYQAIGSFNLRDNKRSIRDEEGGDKFFRNDNNKFIDISAEAGIYGSVIGFGLGITVGDLNNDNWPDIYVSNDFFERDYIYINNQDGTFSEDLEERMASISAASMGADMADINNDGRPDIFVTEMLPGDDKRLKTKTTFDDWDRYTYNYNNGYYHQYNRNMLQLGNEDHSFTEVGRHMGVHATDWSWGALISDFDNDGWKDLFIANGIHQDLTDQDFLNYIADADVMKSMIKDSVVNYAKLLAAIPSNKIKNYLFKNSKGNSFKDVAEDWGLGTPSHSNGSAYGDLDNDGDLDLIVNNVNMAPFIYRNNNTSTNWVQFKLIGEGKNTHAINTKIVVETDAGNQYFEFMPQKGFQSSMDYITHVGLGAIDRINKVKLQWPDGKVTLLDNLEINKRHQIFQKDATKDTSIQKSIKNPLLKEVSLTTNLTYLHKENKHVDFDRERLLYNMKSTTGPSMIIADLNQDGEEDIIFGGASNQATEVWLQNNGSFRKKESDVFDEDAKSEVQDLLAMDFDSDGDLDLISIHGGIEFTRESSALKDRVYINDGRGGFSRSSASMANMGYLSNKAITQGDFNQDEKIDLFIGEGLIPFLYGVPGRGMVLSQTETKFEDKTGVLSPDLKKMGLINDAVSEDLNNDGFDDLVVVGDYMPIQIFMGSSNGLLPLDSLNDLSQLYGWWNTIKIADIDNDNDLDLIIGNHGTNSRFKADKEHPVCMHINDFDQNGSVEQIVCVFNGESSYPLALRHDLVKQLPGLKKKYLKYDSYVNQTIEDLFTEEQRANMITLKATEMRSMVLLNDGTGKFSAQPLPTPAQLAPIYAIETLDINQDGNVDLLLGGNLYSVKPEVGRYDATDGLVLLGHGDGSFTYLNDTKSGFTANGEIRSIKKINIGGKQSIIVARNNDNPLIFQLN